MASAPLIPPARAIAAEAARLEIPVTIRVEQRRTAVVIEGAALKNLHTIQANAATVYAVGGPAATAMRASVPWWPNQIPLVGSDRYDTADRVAASALFGHNTLGRFTVVGITTGLDFPDAMSGGALVGSQGGPLLLANPNGVSPTETAILRNEGLSDVAVTGGPVAVSNIALTLQPLGAAIANRPAPPLR